MTFIQAELRKKQEPESVHRPEIGRRSASGLRVNLQYFFRSHVLPLAFKGGPFTAMAKNQAD